MKILVVDDEVSILQLMQMTLELEHFEVITSKTGLDALSIIRKEPVDLIILDAMLPDTNGFSLIPKIKHIADIPIIMLTAKNDINDKILGLKLGADDYITKPFNSTELILRVKIISKRSPKKVKDKKNKIVIGDLQIEKKERKLIIDSNEVTLTYKEFEVLKCLCENKGKVFSREELLNKVWGYDFEGTTRAVDILIQRLRKKLGTYQKYIKTLYKAGYKVEVDDNEL